jgi:HAD superfamily hydrolase (TIGR01662 family)
MQKKIQRVLVLDLDNTVRISKSGATFPKNPADIVLIPGIKERVQLYKELGYFVAAATNQGGVAYGFKTEANVQEENKYTNHLMGGVFDLMAYSAKHEKGKVHGYNIRSLMRKPDYGMLVFIEMYMESVDVAADWDNSLFVGDSSDDARCAERARVPFMNISEFLTTPLTDELVAWLDLNYDEDRICGYKSERVYEYVNEGEANEYGGDYEQAYDELCKGDAIEHDIATEMHDAIKTRFGIDVWDRDTPSNIHVRTHMGELIGKVFAGFGI